MSRIISFRGLLADNGQERLSLETIQGTTGYKIVKLQLISNNPTGVDQESVVQVWKEQQTAIPLTIDFSDNRLLAAAFYEGGAAHTALNQESVIFDNEIFNQDIYVTHNDQQGGLTNWYIELEVIELNQDEAIVTTLKDIRNSN